MGFYTESVMAIHVVRTARRVHQCNGDWAHDRIIRPGERYTISKLPPHSEIGNIGWWVMKYCAQCLDLPAETP